MITMKKNRHQFFTKSGLCFFLFASVLFLSGMALPGRAEVIDRVVAVVGGDVVTLSDLDAFCAQFPDVPREKVLELLIEDMLVEQEAKRQGIHVTDAEVEASVQSRMAQLGVSEEEFNRLLVEQGLTLDQFKQNVREKLMKFKFVQQQVRGGIEVSDEEALNFYRLHQKEFQAGDKYHLAHILLPFPLSTDLEQQEKIRKLAAELRQRIVKGEDFAEIARKYSRGGNASGGGDIDWLSLSDMNPSFQKALEGLKTGDVTAPFETDQGMHILKIIERKGAELVPFEDVKQKIYEYLYEQRMQEELLKLVAEIKDRTPIERKL